MQTKSNKNSHFLGLSPEQQTAFHLVLAGKPDREIAEAINVRRETVNRWLNQDPQFMAAVNVERIELWEAARLRLLSLTEKAINTVEAAMDQGNVQAALSVLKTIITIHGSEELETDPDAILFNLCKKEAEAEFDRAARQRIAAPMSEFTAKVLEKASKDKGCEVETKIHVDACQRYAERKGAAPAQHVEAVSEDT